MNLEHAADRLSAAGYSVTRTRVRHIGALTGVLRVGRLRAAVHLGPFNAVLLYQHQDSGEPVLLDARSRTRASHQSFTVDAAVSRAIALAGEIGATP